MSFITDIHDEAGVDAPLGFGGQENLSSFLDPAHLFTDSKRTKRAKRQQRKLDRKIANVTREQWAHFKEFYRPIEQAALERAQQTDFTKEGDEAGATAAAGVRSSRGMLSRQLSRAGTSLTAEERSAVNRRHTTSLTRAVGRAENTTRRGLSDSRTNLLAGMVGIGRGVANTAMSGMNTVGNLAAARTTATLNQESQNQQSRQGVAATVAGYFMGAI